MSNAQQDGGLFFVICLRDDVFLILNFLQNPEMSVDCRKQLTRRQTLMATDYKVSRNLRTSCKKEIEKNRCRSHVDRDSHNTVKLAEILLCLEDVVRNGEAVVGGECLFEMREHRR